MSVITGKRDLLAEDETQAAQDDSAARSKSVASPVAVCLAAESFFPVYAGPAVRFTRYLPGLAARGVQVRVFTATPNSVKARMSGIEVDWEEARLGELLPPRSVHGVEVVRVRVPDEGALFRSALFSHRLADACIRTSTRPELVQLLSLPPAAIPALVRLRRAGIPTVFTKTMVAGANGGRVKRGLARRQRSIRFGLVSCVVVSSDAMAERLAEIGVRTRVEVIPNGVDTERFRPVTNMAELAAIRRRLGISEGVPVLLFVGPVSPRKRVDLLLEAWCRLAPAYQDLQLLIVGPRRDAADPAHAAFSDRLENLRQRSGAPERVHYVGLVENVEDYMRCADIFAFTSEREGMPNVIGEAMACGLPVVSTPFAGFPAEFGRAGREYRIAGFDPEALAAELRSLLDDGMARDRLGKAGRHWVESRLSVERSLDRYAELYRAVRRDATGVKE